MQDLKEPLANLVMIPNREVLLTIEGQEALQIDVGRLAF